MLVWVKASRPKTLIASLVPILVGTENFLVQGSINNQSWVVILGCLIFISLIQISTNLANDYFDSKTGVDQFRKNAPERFVSTGKIEAKQVLSVVYFLLFLAFCVGIFTLLFSSVSYWFLPLGVLCIALSILYTGGPYPLAYNGLGDIFVVLFFGLVAVEGTNYFLSSVNSLVYTTHWKSAISVGFLINNLLVVNNYRDYQSDSRVGKNTTIVIFGKKFGAVLFLAGVLFPVIHGYFADKPLVFLILLPSLISFFFLLKSDRIENSNMALTFSALSVLVYGVCWSA